MRPPEYPVGLDLAASAIGGCPSGQNAAWDSVHARVRRLQAIDREEAHLDRPHGSAPRRDPEILPVRRAAELLARSACRTRRERSATPQAAPIRSGVPGWFERWRR